MYECCTLGDTVDDIQTVIDRLRSLLDSVNIPELRQQIENEIARLGRALEGAKAGAKAGYALPQSVQELVKSPLLWYALIAYFLLRRR